LIPISNPGELKKYIGFQFPSWKIGTFELRLEAGGNLGESLGNFITHPTNRPVSRSAIK